MGTKYFKLLIHVGEIKLAVSISTEKPLKIILIGGDSGSLLSTTVYIYRYQRFNVGPLGLLWITRASALSQGCNYSLYHGLQQTSTALV